MAHVFDGIMSDTISAAYIRRGVFLDVYTKSLRGDFVQLSHFYTAPDGEIVATSHHDAHNALDMDERHGCYINIIAGSKILIGGRQVGYLKNKPILYITYMENGEHIRRGPFFTASPDGSDGKSWTAYQVQDKSTEFRRITVPFYHTLEVMMPKEG